MTLWTLHEIQKALGAPVVGENVAIDHVYSDSRNVQAGTLFFALKGETADGHAYVEAAAQKGAVAAVVAREVPGGSIPQIVVADTYNALLQLAQAARARFEGKTIALTGSMGKTTVANMLGAIVGAHFPKSSLNNHVGLPLTMVRLPQKAPYAALEIGTNAPGEIAPLSQLAKPDVALITNVAPVHLAGLGSVEGVRQEKLSIAEGLAPDGVLVVPESLDISGCAWQGEVQRFNPEAPLPAPLENPTPARVACANAALATLKAAGADIKKAAQKLVNALVLVGRGQQVKVKGVTIIDDSYNANPTSMAAALQALKAVEAPRRYALLGDMLELGAEAQKLHVEMARHLDGIDGVWAVGPLMKHMYDSLPPAQKCGWVADAADLDTKKITQTLQLGDVLLVKASKSILWVHGVVEELRKAVELKD